MNDPTTARLETLRAAARSEPRRGDVRYLLAAEWATAGRYDLAVEEMSRAIELDPGLHTARLQLGLLHLTCARPAEACAAWSALEVLPRDEPLRIFAEGLQALARDELGACVALLEAGMRANQANPALNRDMALIVERVRALGKPDPGGKVAADPADAVRTDFSLYEPNSRK